MRLLIDSHAFLWFCEGSNSLSATARTAIENPANEIFLSHAAAWEIAIKVSIGKLQLQAPYEALIPGALDSNGFKLLLPAPSHFAGAYQTTATSWRSF
jgi:PIN domain nuclease of toxin-antitoxin system